MKKNILYLIPSVVLAEPKEIKKPNIDGLKYVFGLGAGGMQQNDTLKAREDNGQAFIKNQHPYAVNTALASAHLGVRYYKGMAYLGAYTYGVLSPLNKEVYRSVVDGDAKDYISVKTTGAFGVMGQAGIRFNDVTPYAILGIQYGPRSLTYTAEDDGKTTKKTYKNKQPVFLFGLGIMGHASDNVTIGLELYRKMSYDFTVKLPDAGGNVRLSGDFLTVKTARWAVQGVVSFEF